MPNNTYNQAGLTYNAAGTGLTYNGQYAPTGVSGIPFTPCSAGGGQGWTFWARQQDRHVPIYFTTTGDYSFDITRDVPRQITGLVLIPQERAKLNLSSNEIEVWYGDNGECSQFGVFRFTESSRQVGVVRNQDGTAGDLTPVTLNDRLVELKRNTGAAHSLAAGADPSQAMQSILSDANIPSGISGSASPILNPVTWDGSVEDISRLNDLATLAGHRQPWSNNSGVVRSIPSQVVSTDIIDLLDLRPTAGSIVITDNYLSAPNRVIVTDNSSAGFQIVGQWDAPASAPNSESQRGWIQTQVEQQQGLYGNAHADEVAATIGQGLLARQLDVEILVTTVLDGPVVLGYDNAVWLLQGWSTSTAPGSKMQLTAKELILV